MIDEVRWAASDRYPLLKDFARRNRLNPTDAEIILWQELRRRTVNTKFFRQYIIADYIVDFVSIQHMLVIEIDGAYHSEPVQQEYDEGRTERLESLGFRVLRFSNEEVLNKIEVVINSIKIHIQNYGK